MSRLVSPRGIAALVFIAGLVIGSAADDLPHRTPLQVGDYWILAGDFHVHAFPGDGSLNPWMLRDEARRAGLDVIAVTNHNMLWPAWFARWIASFTDGPIVLFGQEVTSPGYHLIALGIEHLVPPNQPAADAIADIHAQGGIAIAAHPMPTFDAWNDAAVRMLDGTETAYQFGGDLNFRPQDFEIFFLRARELKVDVAPIGSSDFHTAYQLGECRTLVFVREPTAAGVLDAIRHGRTVAEDAGGRYGDPHLVQLLERASPPARRDAHPLWRQISLGIVGSGLIGILVLPWGRFSTRRRALQT